MLKIKFSILNFITKTIPILLLGLNYILYNALDFDAFKNAIRVIAVVLLVLGFVVRRKWSFSRMELLFAFVVIFELILNRELALNLLVAFVLAIVLREDDFDVNTNRFLWIGILLVIIMIFALLFGLSSNVSYVSTMGRDRSTLGFENPNVASLFYDSVIFIFILSRPVVKIRDIIFSLLVIGLVYFFTDSRTTFYTMLVFLGVLLLMRLPSFSKVLAKVCMYVIDGLFILNLASVFFINRLFRFDALFSFRISSYSNMIRDAGIRGFLFGGTTLTVDSFYYMMLFEYGIIIYILFAVMVHLCMKNLCVCGKYCEVAFMLAFFIIGIMESSIIRPEILAVPLVWILIFTKKKKNELYIDDTVVSS